MPTRHKRLTQTIPSLLQKDRCRNLHRRNRETTS